MPRTVSALSWSAAEGTYFLSGSESREDRSITPDSPAWFAWLTEQSSFAFHGQEGSYSARLEAMQRGERYWYAYRRTGQKVRKKYLGKTADLTLARLEQVARVLQAERTHVVSPGSALPVPNEAEHLQHAEQLPALPPPVRQRELDADPQPLPVQPTRLIGREQDIAQLRRSEVHLLTLTGPGGVGKTRLALEAARDLVPNFSDGVCFVPLSAIREPDFVLPAIAQQLGLREIGARPLLEQLHAALGEQSRLLLLDNFEQVLPAAPLLSELLGACQQVSLLVTSRAALRLSGEYELAVLPLALPSLSQLPAPDALAQYGACALFVERVQAIQHDFL